MSTMRKYSDDEVFHLVTSMATEFFVSSPDFNGILASSLAGNLGLDWDEMLPVLERGLTAEAITLAFERHQGNPHIKRLETLPVEEQIQCLRQASPDSFCIYPAEVALKRRPDLEQFVDRPFTRRLALGEPQLALVYFELGVLERYYRNPRYQFEFGSFGGKIALTSDAYESDKVHDRDKVFL